MMSAQEKRREALEIKPKLSLALKLQVTKQDLANRPHYQEVAEVFEEMLQAACKGLTHLPPRVNRLPGQLQSAKRSRITSVQSSRFLTPSCVRLDLIERRMPVTRDAGFRRAAMCSAFSSEIS